MNRIKRAIGWPNGSARTRVVRGRYDAAQTTEDNRRHWANADSLSARAANAPDVRRRLRERARYEAANNSYASGIVQTLANDLVGTGPRLQLTTSDPELNRRIEAEFMAWSRSVNLAEKLRTMRRARAVDGEVFGLLTTNERVPGAIKLDVLLIEADQVETPFVLPLDPLAVSGIQFDERYNPIEYHVLKIHPGDGTSYGGYGDYDIIPAEYMIHWFRPDRPHQFRGIPELTPALPLFAQLRRYTLAVLAAAETAADFAAVLESEATADDSATPEPFDRIEIESRMMTTLPSGMKLSQFDAKQPSQTYSDFKHELLNEIARCLNVTYNVAAGNSSSYNYSSGRLDHQVYHRSIRVDRSQLELVAMDRILSAWITEAETRGDVPIGVDWSHRWLWPGFEHVDPQKEAAATQIQLQNYLTTFSDECQKQGVDPETRAKQIADDLALLSSLGIPIPTAWAVVSTPDPQSPPDGSNDNVEPA